MGLSIAGLKKDFSLFFIRRKQIEPNKADQTDVFVRDAEAPHDGGIVPYPRMAAAR
jgi:hypothetical protein